MRISEYAVKNYQFTLLLFLMAVVMGVVTLFTMPRSEDPEIGISQFTIAIVYPGTAPSDLETLVVNPIEKKINELEDVRHIKSTIGDGLATINVEFAYNNATEGKYQELVREVNSLRPSLPTDIPNIGVYKFKPSDVNIIQVALISENAPRTELRSQGEALRDALQRIPMLKKVEIQGIPEQVVRIELKLEKMAQMHIPLQTITSSLNRGLANVPAGGVVAGTKFFSIRTSENDQSLDKIRNLVVYSTGEKNILLKDLADIYFPFDQDTYITRLNGHRCIFLSAALKPGLNITDVQKVYLQTLSHFRAGLPSNISMVHFFDQADNVNQRLSSLAIDCLIAILLVSITLMPLGLRAASIVMLSIPLSLSIGLIFLNLAGITLNQISIVGLVVALGLLVDDSIVVVENIERWLREGHSRMVAVTQATRQIGLSVVGCTVTLVIAFLPLVLLPGSSGDFIRGLPLAVIFSVLASMLVALTVIPFLASHLLKEHKKEKDNMLLRGLQYLIQVSYSRFLDIALKHPVITAIAACGIFLAALGIIPLIGFALFPASEKPQFMVNIITPLQTNFETTDSIASDVERVISATPSVKYFATNVGKGNPRIYYNVSQEREREDFAQIFVQLEEHTSAWKKLEIISHLRDQFRSYVGARVEVKNFEQGPGIEAPVEVRLSGNNLDTLRKYAGEVENLLRQTLGTIYVNNPAASQKSHLQVLVNWNKASALGIEKADIDRTIRLAAAGLYAGRLSKEDNRDYAIYLTTPRYGRPDIASLSSLMVNSPQGISIPIGQIARFQMATSPAGIEHYNRTRTIVVSAFVQRGYLNDRVIATVVGKMHSLRLPSGYNYTMGGDIAAGDASFGGTGMIVIATAFLFIGVLVLMFRTFKSMLIVLSVIPLGVVGALAGLWITGNPLSFVAIIGMIALVGVEVKNSILLVDFTNQLRRQGMSVDEAVRKAGEVRFLPIVLTSLTAIGGLLTIALSVNPLISPLAIVLIGGLISSTILSRIVTPVIYKLISPAI